MKKHKADTDGGRSVVSAKGHSTIEDTDIRKGAAADVTAEEHASIKKTRVGASVTEESSKVRWLARGVVGFAIVVAGLVAFVADWKAPTWISSRGIGTNSVGVILTILGALVVAPIPFQKSKRQIKNDE